MTSHATNSEDGGKSKEASHAPGGENADDFVDVRVVLVHGCVQRLLEFTAVINTEREASRRRGSNEGLETFSGGGRMPAEQAAGGREEGRGGDR